MIAALYLAVSASVIYIGSVYFYDDFDTVQSVSALIGIYLVVSLGGSVLVDYLVPGYHQTHLIVRNVEDDKISVHSYSDDYPILVDRDIEYRVDTSFGSFEEGSCYRVQGKGKTFTFEDNAFLQDLFNYRPDRVVTTILSKESCPSPLK